MDKGSVQDWYAMGELAGGSDIAFYAIHFVPNLSIDTWTSP